MCRFRFRHGIKYLSFFIRFIMTMTEKNEIRNFKHLPGHNCVTTAIRNIINHYGFRYQEPMIFGLAEGLGFQFRLVDGLENPYLSGVAPGLVESFCRNLDLPFDAVEFDSDKDAMADLKDHIDRQIPVMVQVDLFYLPYIQSTMHFAGHRVVPVGYDAENIYLADTGFHQIQECPIDKFVEARKSTYPPFMPNRRRVRIDKIADRPFVEEMITKALFNLSQRFLNHQPGCNLLQIYDLRDHLDAYKNPRMLYTQIEKAGTGGGLSRKLYADFLDQAAQMYSRTIYELASSNFAESAKHWSQIAVRAKEGSFDGAGETLESINDLETRGIQLCSAFEADDL
jgi:hypothetical protein